jgi:hypothetical protein
MSLGADFNANAYFFLAIKKYAHLDKCVSLFMYMYIYIYICCFFFFLYVKIFSYLVHIQFFFSVLGYAAYLTCNIHHTNSKLSLDSCF